MSETAEINLTLVPSDEILEEFRRRDLIGRLDKRDIISAVYDRGLDDEFEDDFFSDELDDLRDDAGEFGELVLDHAGRLRSAAYAKDWHTCMDLAERLEGEAHKWSR